MKKIVKKLVYKLIPSSKRIMEILDSIPQTPMPWDEAAVQLHQLRLDVLRIGRPQYLYGLLCAARTAQAIGEKCFTAIEFGVAGGRGLIAMERYAEIIEKKQNIQVQIVGFDASSGLPSSTNPLDCPFAFRGGEFPMDEEKLRSRIKRAELRLGDVAQTVQDFIKGSFAPIGFVSNDLDLYTSTRDSFALFHAKSQCLLPRIAMYFDDLIGYPYTTINGEWAAIKEFNAISPHRQIGQIYGLKYYIGLHYRFEPWTDMFFMLDVLDHPNYNLPEKTSMPDLRLRET